MKTQIHMADADIRLACKEYLVSCGYDIETVVLDFSIGTNGQVYVRVTAETRPGWAPKLRGPETT